MGIFERDLEEIEPLGIIITKYQVQSTVHNNVLKNLRKSGDAPVFDTMIRQAIGGGGLRRKTGVRLPC